MRRLEKRLGNSKINYYSDLFVCAAVIVWIAGVVIFTPVCIYSTVVLMDTSVWSYWVELCVMPLSTGLGLWMIKNCVNHAMYNRKGEEAPYDFPKVNADGEDDSVETINNSESEDSVG